MNTREVFKPTLIASALAGFCLAQPVAVSAAQVGPQFAVYSSTPGQSLELSPPTLAVSNNGFVVGWSSRDESAVVGTDYISVFASDGTPRAASVSLGSSLGNSPAVAMDADGDFVTSWIEPRSETAYFVQPGTLYARRYSSTGDAKGNALRVASVTNYIIPILIGGIGGAVGIAAPTQVAMDDAGDFVVAWEDNTYVTLGCHMGYPGGCIWGSGSSRIYAASYRANGMPFKWKTSIDRVAPAKTTNMDELAGMAMLGTGGFEAVITGVHANVAVAPTVMAFNKYIVKSGTPPTLGNITGNVIDTGFDASGNIDTLWFDGTVYHVSRFAADGTALGADAVLDLNGPLAFPSLAVAPSGAFAVAWIAGSDEIDAQYFNADGSVNGPSFVVNPASSPDQYGIASSPTAALDASGHLVVVWKHAGSDGVLAILGRTVSGP